MGYRTSFRHLLLTFLSLACTENSFPKEDLGPFFSVSEERTDTHKSLDYPTIEGLVFEVQGPYIVLAGLTRLLTPSEPDLGEPLPYVRVSVHDMTQALIAETVSDEGGAFALAVPVASGNTYGYVALFKEGLPEVRQFDRPFTENWTNMRLRMLDESLYSIPKTILGQRDENGYVQGSVYDRISEVPMKGVKISASSGVVAYLSDGIPVPKTDLTETQSQGVFFVANCRPGPLTITASKEGQILATVTVLTWPSGILTQVGIPVPFE